MSAYSLQVKRLECGPCEQEQVPQPFPTEAHHGTLGALHGKPRIGDDCQLPLCAWHHRGVSLPGVTRIQMTHKFGPSLAHDKIQFFAAYGSQEQQSELAKLKVSQLEPATA